MDRSEFQSQEVSERGEAVESTESRALEEATFEPAAYVEGMGDYQQAEAIQTSLEMVMASLTKAEVPVEELSATPITLVVGSGEPASVSDRQQEIPHEGPYTPAQAEDTGEGSYVTPINIPLPIPGNIAIDGGGIMNYYKESSGVAEIPLPGTAGEQVGATPINLRREADVASSAGGVAGSGAEGVGVTPINLPREADLASGGGVAGSGAEGVGITPINLPREANVVSDGMEGGMGGSAVAAGGLKDPGGDGVASGAVKGPGGDGVADGTVRGPGGGDPASGIMWKGSEGIPVHLPSEVVGSGEPASVSDRQQEIPREGPYTPAQAEDTGEGSYVTPINIPLPNPGDIAVDGGGIKHFRKEPGGTAEMPLPGTAGESAETAGESAVIDQIVVNAQARMEEMSQDFNQ
jgi:hypothetical protein